MSISIIKNNSVIYPTEVYRKYNLYLIDGYEEFLKNTTREPVIRRVNEIILELQDLLFDNSPDEPNAPMPITKILNVTEWEDELVRHYKTLNESVKYRNEPPILKIETFLRKEKLEKLNSL